MKKATLKTEKRNVNKPKCFGGSLAQGGLQQQLLGVCLAEVKRQVLKKTCIWLKPNQYFDGWSSPLQNRAVPPEKNQRFCATEHHAAELDA